MKRKEINRKMTLMLESLFSFSTRDLLVVCVSNSKVIKNILKPWNRVWGSSLERRILASSSFCLLVPLPSFFHPSLEYDSCLNAAMELHIYMVIRLSRRVFAYPCKVYQGTFYHLFPQMLSYDIAVLVVLPLAISGSLLVA